MTQLDASVLLISLLLGLYALVSSMVYGLISKLISKPSSWGMPPWLFWLFAASAIIAPIAFSAVGVYLITGGQFWQSLIGVILLVSAFVGLVANGLLIANRGNDGRDQLVAHLTFVVWLILLGSALPLASQHTQNSLSPTPLAALVIASAGGLGLMLLSFIKTIPIKTWHYGVALVVLTPVLLVWAGRPTLISDRLSLTPGPGPQGYGSAAATGLALVTLLILSVFWFIKTPVKKAKPKSKR